MGTASATASSASRRHAEQRQTTPNQVLKFGNTNHARIAQEFGRIGIRVEDPTEIAPAIQSVLRAEQSTIIDVGTTPNCHPLELWRPTRN